MGEIRVKSENLFDKTHAGVDNAYLLNNGTETSNGNYFISEYIKVNPSTNYTLSAPVTPTNPAYCIYNGNKQFITGGAYQAQTSIAITTPNNAAYIRLSVAKAGTYKNDNAMMLNSGSTALPYQPYFLNLPAHEKTADGWKDIPTHIMTATGWQGELTSQSPLEFRATGQSLLDWRIDGASGGVGDWDETEQQYKIPVTVNGTTTNLYTTSQLMDGDSLDYTTDQTSIPITQGDNTLTVGTAVQPSKVFVKFEG